MSQDGAGMSRTALVNPGWDVPGQSWNVQDSSGESWVGCTRTVVGCPE